MKYFVKEIPKSLLGTCIEICMAVQILDFLIIRLKGKICTTRLFDKKNYI